MVIDKINYFHNVKPFVFDISFVDKKKPDRC